ncbi:hypothetical protein D3C78_1775450 [compost metagenome]
MRGIAGLCLENQWLAVGAGGHCGAVSGYVFDTFSTLLWTVNLYFFRRPIARMHLVLFEPELAFGAVLLSHPLYF